MVIPENVFFGHQVLFGLFCGESRFLCKSSLHSLFLEFFVVMFELFFNIGGLLEDQFSIYDSNLVFFKRSSQKSSAKLFLIVAKTCLRSHQHFFIIVLSIFATSCVD